MANYLGFWIYDDQIAGSSTVPIAPDQWALGFCLVEVSPDWEETMCYWDKALQAVQQKPDRPAPNYYWNSQTNTWQLPSIPSPPALPQWATLADALRGSTLFNRSYTASEQSTAVNAAFTLLMATLNSGHNLNDLRFALQRLRIGLQALEQDFLAEELEWLRSKLVEYNFDPSDFDLSAIAE